MIDQLNASAIRFFEEDSIRSGSPAGNVYEPRLVAASAGREVKTWETAVTPFRAPAERSPIHEDWQVKTRFELSPQILEILLIPHLADAGSGVYRLDRTAAEPTFCLQMQFEGGDLVEFRGLALAELGISVANNQIGAVEATWLALERVTGSALEAVTVVDPLSTSAELVGRADVAVAVVEGELAADTRDDVVTTFGVDCFISRPDLRATNYDPTGSPSAYQRSAWRATASISAIWTSDTETAASSRLTGAIGLLIGPDGADIDLRVDEASIYVETEAIIDDDFRDARLLVEAFGDSSACLLEARL